jgi:hypothetical protein
MTVGFKLSHRLALGFGMVAATAALLAACAGDSPTMPVSTDPITSITISPPSASLVLNGTLQLAAVLKDSAGAPLTGRVISWSTDAAQVASVSPSGLVEGDDSGTATITATSEGKHATATITVTRAVTTPALQSGYFVGPTGTSAGDGTRDHPWDLATALNGANGQIQPGDTVWLRGGTYSGNFLSQVSGTQAKPIVFRQFPNERATIDGTLRANGADVWFWGFEVMRSTPNDRLPGLESRGARQKYINMVVHDAAQQGITFWDEAVDAELYGNIVYNNGTHENLDHGTYVHNEAGTKLIDDNVFFNNLAYGIHVYVSPGQGAQQNVHVIGNISFNNGTISANYPAKGNILIGGEEPGKGHQAINNLLFFSGNDGVNMQLGYIAANQDVVATGNMIWGGATALKIGTWSSAIVQNNTIGGSADLVDLFSDPTGYTWGGNTFYRDPAATAWRAADGVGLTLDSWKQATGLGATDAIAGTVPTKTQVFVKPNKYEAGRAFVVVYNFGGQGSVQADLSAVLRSGQHYEVHNVQDLYGAAVASGTYSGGTITLPMTGVNPPARIGRTTPTPPRTGPAFDTFLVVAK